MIIVFDSHPVQYKVPVYQCLQTLRPGSFKVIYASDCSVRGYADRDFGGKIAWDVPLLAGYASEVLHNEVGEPLRGFRSLSGKFVWHILCQKRPQAVLMSQFLYAFDLAVFVSCLFLQIPIWIRHETQDEAFTRSLLKSWLRSLFYRLAYTFVSHAFYIGRLSREHLLRHGLSDRRLSFAPYCVPPLQIPSPAAERAATRQRLQVEDEEVLIGFSGKFIPKKNPLLIFDALQTMPAETRESFKTLFVGSGELEMTLREKATLDQVESIFTGFVNQSAMPGYYLAMDVLILPSRRMGETWGLVVNEALQAGCSVIMTEAVGCHREFGEWERVRVIPVDDAAACARAIKELASMPRSLDWCSERMKAYSVEAAAQAIAAKLDSI